MTQKAVEILETHHPEPLPDDVRGVLDQIAKEAEKALEDVQFVV